MEVSKAAVSGLQEVGCDQMKLVAAFFVGLFLLFVMGCTTLPTEPENGPPEGPPESEPVPGPAPQPEPGEGRIMGYDGKLDANGTLVCSGRAAHKKPVPQGRRNPPSQCYDLDNFRRYCQSKVYSDEGQCSEVIGGRK